MSQPTPYDRAFSFQSYQAGNPSLPLPADQHDLEYNRIKETLDAILANIALIQRDDGAVANESVGRDQLTPEVEIGFNVPTRWAASTAYTAADTVFNSNIFYRSLVAHTSGVFATDLAAAKWEEIADFSVLTQNADQIVYDNTTSLLAADTAQEAIDELASEKLDKAGGTMSGVVSMGGQKITNLGTATSVADALSQADGDVRYAAAGPTLVALALLTTASYGRLLLEIPDEATLRAYAGLELGVDVLAYDSGVAAIAALDGEQGELLHYGAGDVPAKLAVGTSGQVLATGGAAADPAWAWEHVVQTVYAESAATTTINVTTIGFDDSLPTVGGGQQILSAAITPKSSAHKINIRCQTNVGSAAGAAFVVAVFRGSTCVGVTSDLIGSTMYVIPLITQDSPNSASALTYTVRVGVASGDAKLNSNGTTRLFGGASVCNITLQEVR